MKLLGSISDKHFYFETTLKHINFKNYSKDMIEGWILLVIFLTSLELSLDLSLL